MKEPLRISIDTGTIIRTVLVLVSVALLFVVRDILLVLLVAVVIASAATPAIDFLSRVKFSRFRLPRPAAGGVVYFAAIALLVIFFYFFVPVLVSEISNFLNTLPEYSAEFSDEVGIENVEASRVPLEEIAARFQSTIANMSDSIFTMIGTLFGGLFNFILIITISFYLAIQKNGVGKFLALVTPDKHGKYVASLWNRSQRKIGKWFQGMAIDSLVVGAAIYVGLLILGVPYAFFFALLSTLLNFIPIVGPTLAVLPAAAIGIIEGGILLGILVVVLYVGVQIAEGNILFPLVVGKAVGVSPISILIAVGVGAKLGGFLGALLAVPVSAVILEFLNDMRERNKKKSDATDKEREQEELQDGPETEPLL